MKKILKWVVIFLVSLLLGNLLLFLVCLIPRDAIYENVMESASTIIERGNKYHLFGFIEFDNYTEAEIVNEVYSVDSNQPIISYLTMRRCYDPEITQKELENPTGEGVEIIPSGYTLEVVNLPREFGNFLNGKITTSLRYGRYWHGYMVLYRPLFLFFNLIQIRYLFFGTMLILLILNFELIRKKYSIQVAIAFAVSMIFGGTFSAIIQLQLAPIFFITLITNLLFLKNKISFNYTTAFVLGIITNYFDYFTVPLIAVCVPMIFYLLSNPKDSFKDYIIFIITSSICFGFGYGIMWISKVIIYTIFIDNEILKNFIIQVLYRSSRKTNPGYIAIMLACSFIMVFIDTFIYGMYYLFNKNCRFSKKEFQRKSYLIIFAIMPFIYYFAFLNHTLSHWRFTYKHLILTLLSLNLLYYYCYTDTNKEEK